jgi:hypothetical protein
MSEHEEFISLITVAESVGDTIVPITIEIPSVNEVNHNLEMDEPSQVPKDAHFFPESPALVATEEPESPALVATEEPESPALVATEEPESPAVVATEEPESPAVVAADTDQLLSITEQYVQKTLAKVVGAALLDNEIFEQYKLQVSPETKSVLTKLVKDVEFFEEMEQCMLDIIQDGKVDAKDVPQIMLLVTILYGKVKKFRLSKVTTKTCGDVAKTLVNLAIHENIVRFDGDNLILLTCIYDIIDSSIRLMQIKDAMPEVKGIFQCVNDVFRRALGK